MQSQKSSRFVWFTTTRLHLSFMQCITHGSAGGSASQTLTHPVSQSLAGGPGTRREPRVWGSPAPTIPLFSLERTPITSTPKSQNKASHLATQITSRVWGSALTTVSGEKKTRVQVNHPQIHHTSGQGFAFKVSACIIHS